MSTFITSKNSISNHAKKRPVRTLFSRLRVGLLAVSVCLPNGAIAQTRTLPSHGKIRLDSYNYLLRDVHPASQAQANYLQIRLILAGLRKAERLERHERLDVYGERQLIKKLQNYDSITRSLSAGRPTSATKLPTFWMLVSVFGDRSEVYDALSLDVPPIPHDEFVPTVGFIEVVQANGELARPPLLLEGAEGVDASLYQAAWTTLAKILRASGRPSAREVSEFHNSVAAYRKQAALSITKKAPISGRGQAHRYLSSLGSLADALYRPQQCAQIQQYVQSGGYSYYGGNMLGLIQHMLRNRVAPAHGSTAQIALAELARPINRVLEQEIALHYERIDSLAAGEGHRPYAAEYRRQSDPRRDTTPGTQVTQSTTAENAGT